MRRFSRFVVELSSVSVCLGLATSAVADVPRLIQYQGKLVTTAGAFVPGPVDIRVRLYGHATNSTPLYLDETHTNVGLTNGLFSILLGSIAPGGLPDSAVAGTDRWLEVSIGATTLAPRTRLATSPFSMKSRTSEALVRPNTQDAAVTVGASGNVGVGTASPDSSARLDVASTAGGFLPPRMTSAQRDAIPTPAAGLVIFNTTTSCMNMWTGTTWKQSCFDCSFSAPIAGNNSPLCESATLNLTSSTIVGATYAWTGPNAFTSSLQNPSISNVTASASGPYSVTATVAGCTTSPITTLVTVNTIPTPPTLGSNSPLCVGQTLTLTASVVPGATYSWTGPNGFSSSAQNPVIGNVTAAAGGTYTCTVSNSGCSAAPVSTSVVVNSIPAAPASINGQTTRCAGSSGNLYSVADVPGASSYAWTVPSGSTITNGQGTAFITVTFGSTSGNISVTASNSCGTSSATQLGITLQGGGGSQTFSFTGSAQAFTVPQCVSSIIVETWGAQGGTDGGGSGGLGGYAAADLPVTPGEVLNIFVGGQGSFNGGGSGGQGAAGGGGSDVRQGGSALSNRKVVAGGGGGGTNSGSGPFNGGAGGGGNCGSSAGENYCGGAGGAGYSGGTGGVGGFTGGSAVSQCHGAGGGGGGFSSGGAGAHNTGCNCNCNAGDGSLGTGGASCSCYNPSSCHAGGGGAGLYGGGGAAGDNCGSGAGGGGSSWTGTLANPSFTAGTRSGNGLVTFTW